MSGRYQQVGTSPHVTAPDVVLNLCGDCGCAVIDKAIHDTAVHDAACPGEEVTPDGE